MEAAENDYQVCQNMKWWETEPLPRPFDLIQQMLITVSMCGSDVFMKTDASYCVWVRPPPPWTVGLLCSPAPSLCFIYAFPIMLPYKPRPLSGSVTWVGRPASVLALLWRRNHSAAQKVLSFFCPLSRPDHGFLLALCPKGQQRWSVHLLFCENCKLVVAAMWLEVCKKW